MGSRGSESYLSGEQRQEVEEWIGTHETVRVEEVRDYMAEQYGVVYRSKQSDYEVLEAGGRSYHRMEPGNPKHDDVQVLDRREEMERGELRVLREDEGHLVWGEVCGRVWGKRKTPLVVPLTTARQRQTYEGALNLLTQEFHLQEGTAGNGKMTVAYIEWCQPLYPDKKLFFLWDGASSQRGADLREFLTRENAGLPEADWKVTCRLFTPNAPEQNPTKLSGSRARSISANILPSTKPSPR